MAKTIQKGTIIHGDYLIVYDKYKHDDPQLPIVYRRVLLMDYEHGLIMVCVTMEDATPVNNEFTFYTRLPDRGRVTLKGYDTKHMVSHESEILTLPHPNKVQWIRDRRTQQ